MTEAKVQALSEFCRNMGFVSRVPAAIGMIHGIVSH